MYSYVAALAIAGSASALVVPRQDGCCFQLNASGDKSGSIGQLDDGQNRIGGGLSPATYCINNGAITDSDGRGCILTPPTTQFQCDEGATPTEGFSVSGEGQVQYNGSNKFYACGADTDEYNLYTKPVEGQKDCVEVTLSSAEGKCSGSGGSNGESASSSAPAPAGSSAASTKQSTAPAESGASKPSGSAPASSPVTGTGEQQPSAPASSPATGSNEKPSGPAPSAPAETAPSAPAPNAPAPSAPAPSAPAPSAPAPSAPAPSAPAPSAPAPSAPAPSAPAPSAPAPAPSAPAESAPGECKPETVTVTVTQPCTQETGNSGAPGGGSPAHSNGGSGGGSGSPQPSGGAETSKGPQPSADVPNGGASSAEGSKPAISVPATSEASQPSSNAPKPSDNAPQPSGTAPKPSGSVPQGSASTPAPYPTASSAKESSAPAGTGAASSTQGTGTASGSACQTDLSGAYQTPHLIVPVSSEQPDKAYGTDYNGQINETTSTIFNFDIPQDYEGKQCSIIFLFPKKEDLETSSYEFGGSGSLSCSELSSAADEQTSYSNAPSVESDLGTIDLQTGNSYVVATQDCKAGTTQSIELSSENGLSLNFFEDWNPSPLGLYITSC